jgi:hypothetical protein
MEKDTAEQELVFIKKIMEDSHRATVINGRYYISWGIIVSVSLIITYTLLMLKLPENIGWMWLGAIGIGWILSFIIGRRERSMMKARSHTGKIVASVWMGAGTAMTILGFVGPASMVYNGMAICPILASVIGAAYFVSGTIYNLNWVKNLSYAWWTGSIAMFLLGMSYHNLLLFALMMIAFQIIPGLILNNKWKKEVKNTAA